MYNYYYDKEPYTYVSDQSYIHYSITYTAQCKYAQLRFNIKMVIYMTDIDDHMHMDEWL